MRNHNTPWGLSQSATTIAPGIILYTTAGHGGIHLSPERMRELPAHLHKHNAAYCPMNWFEEDREIALVIAGFPQYFSPEQISAAQKTIEQYYPEKTKGNPA